jgi:hypothetical protein
LTLAVIETESKKFIKIKSANDGDKELLLSIEDYYRAFYQTSSNYLLTDWHPTYFMIFNDQSSTPGSKSCGQTCIKHLFKITSDCD